MTYSSTNPKNDNQSKTACAALVWAMGDAAQA